jgi:ABC-2 type transport system permease protein
MGTFFRNTWTIAKREVKTYFTTPVAYVVMTAFLVVSSFFFIQILQFFQRRSMQIMEMRAPQMLESMNLTDWVIRPLFLNIDVIFLLMIPIVTMRLIAEEKKGGTFELLMTCPVSSTQITLGKYFAGVFMVIVLLGLTLIYPIMLEIFSDGGLDWATVGTSYLGMLLMGAAFAAVGLVASSLTTSQVVAAVAGFFALLLFWVIGWGGADAGETWSKVLNHLSIMTHMDKFTQGLLATDSIVYYLSISVLGVLLSQRIVESQRWKQ